MCIWFPMWSLTRSDLPSDKPALVVDQRVTGATDQVLAAGVRLGMPRRQAEALAPFATVLVRDQAEEARLFEEVVTAVEALVPRVEVVSPGLMFIPVSGAVRFYRGEEPLVRRVVEDLAEIMGERPGGTALVGVADGPFAARWAAAEAIPEDPLIVTDTIGFLSRLDLSALRETMGGDEMIDTFRWLGIRTLGELARLPRQVLASRFGDPGVLAHRLASGEDRPVDPRHFLPELDVEMSFEEPLQTLEGVGWAARTLGERLLQGLRSEGVAPHTVTVVVEAADGSRRERVWRSHDPFTEKGLADRVWWQLRAWVETAGVPGGIARLVVTPSDLSGQGRQQSLFGDEASLAESERALGHVQALLGPDRVLQGREQGGRLPGERVAWSRWGEPPVEVDRDPESPWPGATPPPSPSLVPPHPRHLEVEWEGGMPCRVRLGTRWEPVLTWSGPWRLNGQWWEGGKDADRYQIATSVGALLCLVVEGRTFLVGVYD